MSGHNNDNKDLIKILSEINQVYYSNRNEPVSIAMKSYLKNKFECYGLKKPERNKLLKPYLSQLKNITMDNQVRAVKWLWKKPQRELHYLAMEILFRNKKEWTKDILSLFEEMVLSNSWWDSVDTIATLLIGHYFTKWPENKLKMTDKWSRHPNMWMNRTAIIFQMKYGKKTDVDLLFQAILPHLSSKEFFHQKAIGWALRQYSKTDAKTVVKFVSSHPLKPLSAREALRLISFK